MKVFRVLARVMSGALALGLMACGGGGQDYLKFLYDSMPLPDKVMYSEAWWEENVERTLEVRDRMGWDVPER